MSAVESSYEECPLTPAELRVLELLMQGLSYEEIAEALGRKPSTIRSQLNSAYHRLGVRASYQAVLECVRAGWLVWSDDDPETALLIRTQKILRELVDAVNAGHEDEELTHAQRDYLRHLDEHLHARDDLSRHASRVRMDRSLREMLSEAHVIPETRRVPNDLIADLSAIFDRPGPIAA
jgi:DNA-binding CsgD family transcriptional regulator